MGLFKSREEKRMERDIEVRKGLNHLKRRIKNLEKDEKEFVTKAKRAKKMGDAQQLNFIKANLKRTAVHHRMMERQFLSLETAMQIKNQAESHQEFAKGMLAISRSIAEVYGATDLAKTQREFEKSMLQAENLQQRMEILLDMTSETMISGEAVGGEEIVSDQEIDRMLEEELVHEESGEVDRRIDAGIQEIEREMKREE